MGERDVEVESATTGDTRPGDEDQTREVDADRVARTAGVDRLAFRPGDQVGRYVILRELGSGGMSVVYVAYDPHLDRHVALKLVRPGGAISAHDSAPRLQREAQALARLSHPNVVHVYDVGTLDMHVYIAMELVDGKTLRQWLMEDRPSWRDVLAVLVEAGEGLAAAHDAGLVHFDFKPSNVLLGAGAGPRGDHSRVRVVDFGLAREPRSMTPPPVDAAAAESMRSGRLSEQLTEHGAVMGTPGFIAPEHLAGKEADARADQYSFCVTLWQGLYGERPFVGHDRASLQKAVLRGTITLPHDDRGVPAWIQQVLRRGMSVSPGDRYPTLRDLLAELRRDPGGARRRRVAIVAGFVAVGGIAILGLVQAARSERIDCAAGRDRLSDEWGDADQDAVRAAFDGTALVYADDAWRRSTSQLDDYVRQWGEMHVDACEATHVRGEQSSELLDRRMACLQRARLKFAALVDVFEAADADVVRNAVTATQSLMPVSRCADASALVPEPAPPADPWRREQVEAVEAEVARVEAMHEAGRYAEAEAAARRVLEQAQALAHPPLVWEAANLLGDVYTGLGRGERSLEFHALALASAEAAGMDYARAESMREHSFVYGNLLGNTDRAEWFAKSAHAVLDRMGSGPELRADLLSNEAVIVTIAGRIEEGLALNQRAVDLRREAGLAEDAKYALLLGNLAGALYSAGRYEEALQNYLEGLRISTEQLGEGHPNLAVGLENVGNALQALERYDEALGYHRRAIELSEAYSVGGPKLALQHSNFGVALFGMERYDEAERHYRSSLAIWRASSDAHPGHAVALCNLGELELRTGRVDDARAHYEEGLRILQAAVDDRHPWLAVGLTGFAAVLIEQGEYERAHELARQAHEIHERTPTDPLAAAETKLHYGRALWEVDAGRHEEARSHVVAAETALAGLGKRAVPSLTLARAWLRSHR